MDATATVRAADSRGAELNEVLDALAWLAEMAGYAHEHLDPEWRRTNGVDHASALGQANSVLHKHGRIQ